MRTHPEVDTWGSTQTEAPACRTPPPTPDLALCVSLSGCSVSLITSFNKLSAVGYSGKLIKLKEGMMQAPESSPSRTEVV